MYSYQKCSNLITQKDLPKIQNYLCKHSNIISIHKPTYEVDEAFMLSDPNVSGSPPNEFMKTLEKRLCSYHNTK